MPVLMVPAMGTAEPEQHPDVVLRFEQDAGAVRVQLIDGTLRIIPCEKGTVHVTYSAASTIPDSDDPALSDAACVVAPFTVQDLDKHLDILAPSLRISVDRNSGAVSFADLNGNPLLSESNWPFPRSIEAAAGDGASRASTWFSLTPDERLYGLGQHQNGILNQRNLEIELSQDNTNISIPFFLSSKGYGVFWNNSSVTRWNNRFQPVLEIRSNVADVVDYYFIYGPEFDRIIAAYRQLTGAAPLFPRWAYGYWQSKLAYASQDEILKVASKYRSLKIPLDNIVLDAGWEDTGFGSRLFNKNYPDPRAMVQDLHDRHIHLMVSIWPLFVPGSANFDEMSKAGFLVTAGDTHMPSYSPGARLYDAFSASARKAYWEQVKLSLFDIGVDAFWMDSIEPADLYMEERGPMLDGAKTALGNGSRYANLYPLMTTSAIYQGQRSVTDRKRVFILSRSAFAGMQRNAAAAWSGDTAPTFGTFKRQIPAGLNYSMTGMPYWTTDIGGFTGGDPSDPAYRELFVRWFEYGSFCPIFRVHGFRKGNQNELWSYGPAAQKILTRYDQLRYRLLPYNYTLAAQTTFDGYTPMRALPFDFRTDPKALDIGDEFMFGPSLLVAPVTDEGSTQRSVYLPKGAKWYDFWTGVRHSGGRNINRLAPLSILPLYVRAGSILPLGPEETYSDQFPEKPLELRIYPGADADLSLYNDDGVTYDYEKGSSTRIAMHWDNRARVLTLKSRTGSFPGMKDRRVFHVVLVKLNHGAGESAAAPDRTVVYDGSTLRIHL
jgi:alpha-D-xyloside xylohydrolase